MTTKQAPAGKSPVQQSIEEIRDAILELNSRIDRLESQPVQAVIYNSQPEPALRDAPVNGIAAVPMTPTEAAFNHLNEIIEEVHGVVLSLRIRLEPVRWAPDSPNPQPQSPATTSVDPTASPIVKGIQGAYDRLNEIHGILLQTRAELEI